jgi:hypothetical protein
LVFTGNGFFIGSTLKNRIMVKKISIILFVLAILVTGYLSFKKLNYWDRSVMIFKYDSSQPLNRGRGGRGFGEFEGREGQARPEIREGMQRPEVRNIPDSLRQRTGGRGQQNINRMRPGSDSLNVIRGDRNAEFSERGGFPGGTRGQVRNGGHDFRGGSNINLKTVLYYLGVFALFAVIAVYIEKGYRLIFKQKKLTQENSDLII